MNFFIVIFLTFLFIDLYDFKPTETTFNFKDLCTCEPYKPNIKPRIINGIEVSKNDFKFLVSMFIKEKKGNDEIYKHFCMGIVLNEDWILSTVHCNIPIDKNYTLYVGGGLDHDLRKIYTNENNVRTISEVHKHPNFEFSSKFVNGENFNYQKNDIALFKLSSPFKLGSETNLYPACLFSKEFKLRDDLMIASYGLTHNSTITFLNNSKLKNLKAKEIKIFNNQTKLFATHFKQGTINAYKFHNFNQSEMILAKNPESSSCEGDRGSALGVNYENKFQVIGVLNFFWSVMEGNVLKRCMLDSFSFSTPIYPNLNWIDSVVDLKNTCTNIN